MPKAHEMSEADAFRKSTAEFWSRMDQKGSSVATRRELTPAHSRKSTVRQRAEGAAQRGHGSQSEKAKQALIAARMSAEWAVRAAGKTTAGPSNPARDAFILTAAVHPGRRRGDRCVKASVLEGFA